MKQSSKSLTKSLAGRRFLVVFAHPVPEAFVRTAGTRAVEALRLVGAEVDVIDLDADGFDPLLGAAEWAARHDGVPESLSRSVDGLRWATDLLLVYPTWFGGFPAMLKGWFDRVWGKGVAWDLEPGRSTPKPLLRNITNVWVVTSHGSSKVMNMVQGEAGRQFVRRTLRLTCARLCRVRWVAFYGNDSATDSDRREYLDHVTSVFSGRSR
jgi:NAD(P)H dehydrogenase (quinone)